MTALDATHGNNLLDASLGNATFSATTLPLRCRLMTTNGTSTTNGTELATGGGYTSGTGAPLITFNAASGLVATSGGTNGAIVITNMPACTIVGVEIWGSAPARKWFGALASPRVVNSGDSFSIAAGSFTISLA